MPIPPQVDLDDDNKMDCVGCDKRVSVKVNSPSVISTRDCQEPEEESFIVGENDSDESTAEFKIPVIPKLKIPINPNMQRFELESVIMPLLQVLRKKLSAIGLDALLSLECRSGIALECESALDEHPFPDEAKEVTFTRISGLKAMISLETKAYLKDEQTNEVLQSLLHGFPKTLLEKVASDFDPEDSLTLVMRLTSWWDKWSKIVSGLLETSTSKKQDHLRRLIEIVEVLEECISTWRSADSVKSPIDNVAEVLHSRAKRKTDVLLKKLDDIPVSEFSLSTRAKVQFSGEADPLAQSQRDPGRRPHRKHFVPILVSEEDVKDFKSMNTTVPIPTVATLCQAPKWNDRAKKPRSKWNDISTSQKRLPPLKQQSENS